MAPIRQNPGHRARSTTHLQRGDRAGVPPGATAVVLDGLSAILRLRCEGAPLDIGEGRGHLRVQVEMAALGTGTWLASATHRSCTMAVWQPAVSSVTTVPFRTMQSSRRRMAVILLLLVPGPGAIPPYREGTHRMQGPSRARISCAGRAGRSRPAAGLSSWSFRSPAGRPAASRYPATESLPLTRVFPL